MVIYFAKGCYITQKRCHMTRRAASDGLSYGFFGCKMQQKANGRKHEKRILPPRQH